MTNAKKLFPPINSNPAYTGADKQRESKFSINPGCA
jgi:hypothetical protein